MINEGDSSETISWTSRVIVIFGAVVALLYVMYLGACCKTPAVRTVVLPPVETGCALPPPPMLPQPKRLGTCQEPAVLCFDAEDALLLIQRDAEQRQWIKEVLIRCMRAPSDAGVGGDS